MEYSDVDVHQRIKDLFSGSAKEQDVLNSMNEKLYAAMKDEVHSYFEDEVNESTKDNVDTSTSVCNEYYDDRDASSSSNDEYSSDEGDEDVNAPTEDESVAIEKSIADGSYSERPSHGTKNDDERLQHKALTLNFAEFSVSYIVFKKFLFVLKNIYICLNSEEIT